MSHVRSVGIAIAGCDGRSGAARLVQDQVRAFLDRGWRVSLATERPPSLVPADSAFSLLRVPSVWWFRRRRRRPVFARRAAARLAGNGLVIGHGDLLEQDVLQLHNCVHLAHELVEGRPMPADDPLGRFHAAMLSGRRFRLVIANSGLMRDDLVHRWGIPPGMIRVVHPGFDPAIFAPDRGSMARRAGREALGLPQEGRVVGLITSGDLPKRGADLLLASMSLLPDSLRSDLTVLVAARPRAAAALAGVAARAGVRVRFVPPQDRVEQLYHACDVFVLPARVEEFGMSALEAMACGVPSIISDRVGAAELLGGSGPGVVPAGDIPALAAALAAFLADPVLAAAWRDRGVAAASPCTWERHQSQVVSCCEALDA